MKRATLLVILLLLLAGCSTNTAPTTSSTTTTTTTATTAATTSPQTTSETPTTSATQPPTTKLTTTSPTSSKPPTTHATPTTTESITTSSTTETDQGPETGTVWTVTIVRVIDGDTMEARFPNGEIDTLRLLGVDTPETTLSRNSPEEYEGIPDTTAGRDHLYNWGEQATTYAESHLEDKTVRIEVDPVADRRGSFGRLLAYIYVDGQNFNKRLLETGHARLYDSTFSLRSEFVTAEATAQQNDVGLWAFTASATTPTTTTTSDIPPLPADGDYDCGHFDTQDQAQQVLDRDQRDPHRLDADDDGIACESLP